MPRNFILLRSIVVILLLMNDIKCENEKNNKEERVDLTLEMGKTDEIDEKITDQLEHLETVTTTKTYKHSNYEIEPAYPVCHCDCYHGMQIYVFERILLKFMLT